MWRLVRDAANADLYSPDEATAGSFVISRNDSATALKQLHCK